MLDKLTSRQMWLTVLKKKILGKWHFKLRLTLSLDSLQTWTPISESLQTRTHFKLILTSNSDSLQTRTHFELRLTLSSDSLFGQRPQRGRSPVEHRGNSCPSVHSFVRSSMALLPELYAGSKYERPLKNSKKRPFLGIFGVAHPLPEGVGWWNLIW